jgi:hypothetical protein
MTLTERRQRVTDTVGELVLLEISAPSITTALRIANDTEDWMSNGNLYIGFPFGFKLPDQTADNAPSLTLQISNVGRGMSEDLERLMPGEILTATLLIADRLNPDVIVHRLPVPIYNVTITNETATATAGVDHIMRQQAVKRRFDEVTAPGLFAVQ